MKSGYRNKRQNDKGIDEEMMGINNKMSTHSDIEEFELGSCNQDKKQRIPKYEKQMTEYMIKR